MKKTLIALSLTLLATSPMAKDHSKMDHANMDHAQMEHGKMDQDNMGHAQMDHSKMDHSTMSMEGISEVGMPAKGAKPDKVVHVILNDDNSLKFKKEVEIESNDVVQFVVINKGKQNHEFMIGSPNEQKKHRDMMKKMEGDHMHDSDSAITVAPGKAKQILWHFHGSKNVELACNIPGHAEAGMVKKITLK